MERKKLNLFKHWNKLEFSTVMDWQRDSNKYGGDINYHTSQWIYDLLYNYSTIELRACVNTNYSSLENLEQGETVYLYLILSEMFQMTTDVVTALKKTLTT